MSTVIDDGPQPVQSPATCVTAEVADACSDGGLDLRELLSALPVAIYMTDAVGRITFYNASAAQLWGREPELGTSAFCGSWKLYWPDGRPMRHDECPMAVTLKTGRPVRGVEAAAERPDGARVPFMPYPTLLWDRVGRLVGAVNMLVDITERKAFEHTVRSQARHFQTLNAVATIVSRDLDLGRIGQAVADIVVDVSGAKFGAFHYHTTDERGQDRLVQAPSPRGTLGECDALLGETLRGESIVRSDDVRSDARFVGAAPHWRTAGEPCHIASYLAVPVRRLGKVHGALVLGHPEPGIFTQEMEEIVVGIAAHAAIAMDNAHLYEAERRLAAIVEASDDAIASKSLSGIVTSWNHGAERLFGYSADEMIGESITKLIPVGRRGEEDEILECVRRGKRVEHYETVRVRKDGTHVDISLTVSPVKNAEGRIIGASKIARDITERKQARARQDLLARELHHRTKNLFAVVHAVVSRSFAGKRTVEEAQDAVLHRLHSLAQTHVMLLDTAWQGADLGEVVRSEMGPYTGRVSIEGPPLFLNAQATQNFALAVHELATNAAKHGALSSPSGRVRINWSVSQRNGEPRFLFRWEEQGGLPVSMPQQRGFGSAVLEQVMAEYFESPPAIQFAPSGVIYELGGRLAAITDRR